MLQKLIPYVCILPSMVPPPLCPITTAQEAPSQVGLCGHAQWLVQNGRAQGLLKEKVNEHLQSLLLPR